MPSVEVADFRLHYETYGSGPPLLLIAGTGSPHTSWAEQIPLYSQRFQCIAYDARGIGLSTTDHRPLTIKDLASDAVALLDNLAIERCSIVGTSMGAATAQEICLSDPGRVERLVLHAPWDRTSAYPHLAHQFELRIELIERGDIRLYERLSQLWLFGPHYFNSVPKPGPGGTHTKSRDELEGVRRLLQANLTHDTRERLDGVRAPTLVTVGEDDFLIRPAYARQVAAHIPGTDLVIWPDVGHLARTEKPETFTTTTLSFLEKGPVK